MADLKEIWLIALVMFGFIFASALSSVDWEEVVGGSSSLSVKTSGVPINVNVSSIDWGVLEPGEYGERKVLLENVGVSPGNLSIMVLNFVPPAAQNFLSVSWDAEGKLLDPQKILAATLRLDVSPLIRDIENFSFDIVIAAE